MDNPIGIRLPKEILEKINKLSKIQMEDRSTLIRKLVTLGYMQLVKEKAAEFYLQGKITLSEAAHQADLTLWEMERFLIERGYKSEYSTEDLEKELALLA